MSEQLQFVRDLIKLCEESKIKRIAVNGIEIEFDTSPGKTVYLDKPSLVSQFIDRAEDEAALAKELADTDNELEFWST